MKTIEIDPQLRFDMQFAESRLRKAGELAPMFVIEGKAGATAVITAWRNDIEKAGMMTLISLLAVAEEASAISMMAESWMLKGDGAEDEIRRGIMPRESGKRIEVVSFYRGRRTPDGVRHRMALAEIKRGPGGIFAGLADPVIKPEGTDARTRGAMTRLLYEEQPSSASVREARRAIEAARRAYPDVMQVIPVHGRPT
jgi:hypothetical protein